jgi:type IV pilus assembly protein PilA
MINHLRVRAQSESGFTLVELLVVMLIIGLLASIAIPAFFNQRNKANDASAKEMVRTAQTAMETYATDRSGSYLTANGAALRTIEPSIPPDCLGTTPNYTNTPCLVVSGVTGTSYAVTVAAKTTLNQFQIVRAAAGTVTYPCSKPTTASDNGGCTIASGTIGTWN